MIIGIGGTRGSGKDTLASMINYILEVGTAKAKYSDWNKKNNTFARLSSTYKKPDTIIHYADNLKDCLSIIYNIRRDYFDNRKYKEDMWYCFSNRKFYSNTDLVGGTFYKIDIKDLELNSLSYILTNLRFQCVIKLRTLLQYFGTNVCRQILGKDIWLNSTITKANELNYLKGFCIIADVRFNNEAEVISKYISNRVIKIERDSAIHTGESFKGGHQSEICDFQYTNLITNNTTLMALYYKALDFVNSLNIK